MNWFYITLFLFLALVAFVSGQLEKARNHMCPEERYRLESQRRSVPLGWMLSLFLVPMALLQMSTEMESNPRLVSAIVPASILMMGLVWVPLEFRRLKSQPWPATYRKQMAQNLALISVGFVGVCVAFYFHNLHLNERNAAIRKDLQNKLDAIDAEAERANAALRASLTPSVPNTSKPSP